MNRKQRASEVLKILERTFPEAECTLDRDTPERLAVRGILSAQCTDVRVNLTCRDLFAKYPSMDMIADAGSGEIGEVIKPCGLHKMKSESVISFAKLYCGKWERTIPKAVNELMECRGIGKKIANLIVGEVYGIPALVVDTHCKRVMKRIGITDETDPLKVEKDVCKVFPELSWIGLGHRAVMLGRTFCTARSPLCETCPLSEVCRKRI